MTEIFVVFGTDELANKVVAGWESKDEDMKGWGITFYESTQLIPFEMRYSEAKPYIDKSKPCVTLFFGEKNGRNSLRNIIENLQNMLNKWEEEAEE